MAKVIKINELKFSEFSEFEETRIRDQQEPTMSAEEIKQLMLNLTDIKAILSESDQHWIQNKTTLYILIIVFSLMIIIAFLLNILILFTVLISKNLHKPNILLSLNLIIANIASATICMPFVMNHIVFQASWINGLTCKLIPFIQAVTVFVISITVTMISIHRYHMITSLKKNKFRILKQFDELNKLVKKFTRHKFFFSFLIWLIAILLSCPILVYQEFKTLGVKNLFEMKACLEQYPESIHIIYAVLTFIIAFIIPIICLTYFHYKIKLYLNANLLKFESTKDKSAKKSSKIKTISSKNQQNLFINLNKKNSDANYYSLIDLNLFNSNDSNSSPLQTRDLYSTFTSDIDRTRLSVQLDPRKKLHKSLTLSNNFQFHSYLQIYRVERLKNRNGLNNKIDDYKNSNILNKSNTINTFYYNEMSAKNRNDKNKSYLSLNQLPFNYLTFSHLNEFNGSNFTNNYKRTCVSQVNDSSKKNEPFNQSTVNSISITNTNKTGTNQRTLANNQAAFQNLSFKDNLLKRKNFNKKSSQKTNHLFRSSSDSNLFENQFALHNSFLHELIQHPLKTNSTDSNPKNDPNSTITTNLTPTYSSQAFNLDYLRLVNFDYNQQQAPINQLEFPGAGKSRRKSQQMKLVDGKIASFTRFNCFLNRVKRFHYINREIQRNQKITFILVLGIIVFAISWLPLNILNLYIDFNYKTSSETSFSMQNFYSILSFCHIISSSSAISNGILYGLLNTNIQKEIIKLFKNFLNSN